MTVVLNCQEIVELDKQPPAPRTNGGYQSLLVGLQERVDRTTGRLRLSSEDLERIGRYAFKYRKGGWQNRLMLIFGRTLGPDLGYGRRQTAA